MPIPINSDNFLTHRDVNSSRSDQQASRKGAGDSVSTQTPQKDSVHLSAPFADTPIRPLSEGIRSAAQAEARIQQLLTSVRESPDAAMKAQTSPSQTQVEALLQNTV